VKVPRSNLTVKLPGKNITISELRRLKKQFQALNKVHTVIDLDKVADLFVEYLNRTL